MKRPHWPPMVNRTPANPAQQRRDGGNADGLGSHSSFRPYTAV